MVSAVIKIVTACSFPYGGQIRGNYRALHIFVG